MAATDAEPASKEPAAAEAKSAAKEADGKEKKSRKRKLGRKKFSYQETPPVHDMVIEALETVHDRKGVTLQAIKRFMEDNYKVDIQRLSSHIRKAVVNGVDEGTIIRTRGNGALGRFKLKPFKVAVANKRQAPQNYAELPATNKRSASKAGRTKKPVADDDAADEPKAKTAKTAAKPTDVKSPKPKRGRPGRAKK